METILATVRKVKGVLTTDTKNPFIAMSDLPASTVNLTVYFWIDTFDETVSGIALKNELVEKTLHALAEAGFYLPSDILELKPYKSRQVPVSVFQSSENGH